MGVAAQNQTKITIRRQTQLDVPIALKFAHSFFQHTESKFRSSSMTTPGISFKHTVHYYEKMSLNIG